MVAISLYKGNLHKVPEVARKWLMPAPAISVKDFKLLLRRRSRALSRITATTTAATPTTSTHTNPNETENNNDHTDTVNNDNSVAVVVVKEENPVDSQREEGEEEAAVVVSAELKSSPLRVKVEAEATDGGGGDGKSTEKLGSGDDVQLKLENVVDGENVDKAQVQPVNLKVDLVLTSKKDDSGTDKEKRKKEVEEKLQILNARKHSLVQVLKQILNAEEELKRRSSNQGMGGRPSIPLQVDTSNDSGSMTRLNTPRLGSDGNLVAEVEGADGDDASNQNMHSRHLLRTSSISPSSDSQYRKLPFNVVPHPSRSALAVAGSPSRFAPPGQQGHPPNPPSVSISGTNYIASSPSPAASGGTSVFRDGRVPSPWN